MDFAGLTVIITGSSQGLGVEIARHFVVSGANVILTARSEGLLEEVRQSFLPLCKPDQKILSIPCDVSQVEATDSLIESVISETGQLDVLINNASIFGPMGHLVDVSWSHWVETMNVNLLGTVYMCRAAIPHLKKSPRGKIINISGGGAARAFPSLCAYGTSKAAVVRFTEELAAEMREYNIDVNVVAPGPLNTRFVDEAIDAGPGRLGEALYNEIMEIRKSGGTPFEYGAKLCTYLASRQSDGVTGKFISARYDEWSTLHERISELDSTEVYTMRRIDPSIIKKFSGTH